MINDLILYAKESKNLIIIGCSLRPEDSILWLILTSFINIANQEKKIIISDKNCNAKKIRNKIKNYWTCELYSIEFNCLENGIKEDNKQIIEILNNKNSEFNQLN